MKIQFLGTGGGRFVTATQMRWTGGFRIEEEQAIHVDPGPAAIRAYRFFSFPLNFSAIFLSHAHIDHVNDVNILAEAVGRKKKILVFGEENAINYLTDFHKQFCTIAYVKPGDKIKVANFEVEFTPTEHSIPALGAIFKGKKQRVWYSSDTEIIEEHYKIKVDVAILNNLRPWGKRIPGHMSSDQVAEWGLNTKPKLIVIQHFGRSMLMSGPENEARRIEEYSGVHTVAAKDGMVLDLDSSLLSFL